MNEAIIITVILSFLAFQIYYSHKYGIQSSISASIYVLQGNEKFLYSFMILITAFGLGIVANTTLGWFAAFLLAIDSFAVATHDNEVQNFLHIFGADFGIAFAMASLVSDFHLWYLVVLFILFGFYAVPINISFKHKYLKWLNYFSKFRIKNHTTWIENAAFVTYIIGLLIKKV